MKISAVAVLLCFPAVSFASGASAGASSRSARIAAVRILSEVFPGDRARIEMLDSTQLPLARAQAAVALTQDPNAKDDDGTTALMRAAKDGHTEIVKILLAQPGVRVDEKDPLGHTALMLAAIEGRSEVVRLLLEAKSDANSADAEGETALHLAAYFGRTKTAQALLDGGADVNRRDKTGAVPLLRAVKGGRASTVAVIASYRDVDLNAKNPDGTTALIEAARSDRDFGIVAVLLEHGADKDLAGGYKDYDGRVIVDFTPLLVSVLSKNVPAAKALLEKGADANRRDQDGNTALILAISGRNQELALMITAYKGADLNAKNNKGITPLIAAVVARDSACVKALIEGKADLNYREPGGKTALGFAKTGWQDKEIVAMLIAAGARE